MIQNVLKRIVNRIFLPVHKYFSWSYLFCAQMTELKNFWSESIHNVSERKSRNPKFYSPARKFLQLSRFWAIMPECKNFSLKIISRDRFRMFLKGILKRKCWNQNFSHATFLFLDLVVFLGTNGRVEKILLKFFGLIDSECLKNTERNVVTGTSCISQPGLENLANFYIAVHKSRKNSRIFWKFPGLLSKFPVPSKY